MGLSLRSRNMACNSRENEHSKYAMRHVEKHSSKKTLPACLTEHPTEEEWQADLGAVGSLVWMRAKIGS